jgi:hypothetical protein
LRYDAAADFEPIGLIADSPMAVVAKKDFPAATFPEFLAYAKTNQAQLLDHGLVRDVCPEGHAEARHRQGCRPLCARR